MRVMTMTKPVLSILLLLLYPIATSANSERGRLLYETAAAAAGSTRRCGACWR